MSSNFASALRIAPSITKYLIVLLLLLNIRSWPLAWHFRVFRPVFKIRIRYKLMQWRNMFRSRIAQVQAEDRWLDSITPIGADPFNLTISYNSWASVDDSDFNGHLSNSSYAKTLDSARFKTALHMFPMFFRAGGWMALAATHYNFIREIPILAQYEVRVSIGTWDQKWLYVVSKFVTKSSKKSMSKSNHKQITPPQSDSEETTEPLFNASVRTVSSPMPSTSQTPEEKLPADTASALKAVTASLTSEPEPDGATLHTVSVSLCCFKVGRITVPPALVMATNGFCVPGVVGTYSPTNPPPNWQHAKSYMSKPSGGSTKKLQELYKGGWRNVPEGPERWWDVAMDGVVEEKRRARLDVMKGLGSGLTGARSL
ncbi:hypothetical protein BDZ94DRAFT_1284916 [Collybia nuda]|uniref:Uncharacterized protein n=1 Tax=Collybia nuda TaxID=64659 RepID=A0A9P6CDK8_9AGAR|nr:hypothetical protein BDZ94DRAFT_1284916 [Collybia nuda]